MNSPTDNTRRRIEPDACFVAGTLVHTKESLKPIEQIQVGDWVLSFPDDERPPDKFRESREYTYKRVLQTFVTENQPVTEFPVNNLATGNIEHFTATPNLPIFVLNHGWMTLGAIYAQRKRVGVENHNFRNLMLGGLFKDKGLATVYNIEVEDFHTYYVGTEGLWVHNCECTPETALATLVEKVELLEKGKVEGSQFCFAAGTLVHTKNGLVPIDQINVGDWVLSRHDNNTGKQAYKRVLKTIQSDVTKPIIMLRYYSELDEKICQLYVTNEHPIFVRSRTGRDIGWMAASTIAHPTNLVSFDGTPIKAYEKCTLWETPKHGVAWGQSNIFDNGPLVDLNGSVPTILEDSTSERAMGGMDALFKVVVYNLEVEDFHTYYVGELGIWVHN